MTMTSTTNRSPVFPNLAQDLSHDLEKEMAFNDNNMRTPKGSTLSSSSVRGPNIEAPKRSVVPVRLNIFDKQPWSDYSKIMKLDQAGPAYLVQHNRGQHKTRVMKELSGYTRKALCRLKAICHKNIVRFTAAYYDNGSIFCSMSV